MNVNDIMLMWVKESCGSNYKMYERYPTFYNIKKHFFKPDELLIFTFFPGVLIGRGGETVDFYKNIFKENNYNFEIKFIELSKYSIVRELKF